MGEDNQAGGLSRREVLFASAGLMFTSIGLTNVLSRPAFAQDATPARGGTLSLNQNIFPPSFDVIGNTTTPVIAVCAPCYNALVQYDPASPDEIIGDLATSWTVSEDGKVYTFSILDGVKFHDGMPLTSADVKYTFDVVRDPPEGFVSTRANSLSAVESIETPDATTVVFNLKYPSPSLLANLAVGWMVILPKHILEKGPMRDQIVGSGPFMLGNRTDGVSIELVRNPNYHVEGRPYLDGINFYVVPDLGTVMSYFRSGQLNVFYNMPVDLARQARETIADKVEVQTALNWDSFAIQFNTQREPWSDVRVRKAVALCIDREAAVQVLFGGDAVLSGFSFPGPWQLPEERLHAIPGYAPVHTAEMDEEAKRLLAEAGYPDGFSTTVLIRKGARHEPWGIFAQDQLAKIGIKATLDIQDGAAFAETLTSRNFDINVGGASVTINEPDAIFGDKVICDGGANYASYCDPEIDRLVALQAQTLDAGERASIAHDLEERVLAAYGIYQLGYAYRYRGQWKNIHEYYLHANQDNNMRHERVWIG